MPRYDEYDQNEYPVRRGGSLSESREQALRRRLRQRGEELDEEAFDERPAQYAPRRSAAPPSEPRGAAGSALYMLLGILAVVLVGIIAVPQLISRFTSAVPASVAAVIGSPTPTVVDRGGTIQQIKALNRLETQQISVERVIEAGVQGNALQNLLFGDRVLLVAGGNVVAGVDMAKLKPADITVSPDGRRITLTLPASEIFSAALDGSRTRVYDRQKGFLAAQNKDLETEARAAAEGEILKAACEAGVMQKAANEAERNMEQFLSLLEFDSVTVNAPIGQCVAPGGQ